jgi:hypothetical protein
VDDHRFGYITKLEKTPANDPICHVLVHFIENMTATCPNREEEETHVPSNKKKKQNHKLQQKVT